MSTVNDAGEQTTLEECLTIMHQGADPVVILLRDKLVRIGSHASNDVVLPEASISPHHAELKRADCGWMLTDLGSETGTYLEGNSLQAQVPEPLSLKHVFRIGGYFLKLDCGPTFTDP